MSPRLLRLGPAAVAVVLGLTLAGCGDQGASGQGSGASASPAGSPSASGRAGAPACDEVWVEGGDIPRGYAGCNDASGFVRADKLGCSSGQRMVRYDDRFYGVVGGSIHESTSSLDDDMDYRDAVASCRA